MLSEKHLDQFIRLYKDRYGVELSREEAHERGADLVNLIRALYKPIK